MTCPASTIEARFAEAMHAVIGAASRLGLAVSGGSDSMALMHLAASWCREHGVKATVLCFDHAIEGENSAAEAEFVRRAADALGLEVVVERADPPVAAGGGKSLEMAAREARMAFFGRMAATHGLDAIATGHQKNDVAETVLLRMLRGAGSAGLSGLRPAPPHPTPPHHASRAPSRVPAIRPLLGFTRAELREWLQGRGIAWMEDLANSNEAIPRCRVRRRALPALAATMAADEARVTDALAQSAEILREEDAFLAKLTHDWLEAHGGADAPLALGALRREPAAIARRVAREWLLRNAGAEASGFGYVESLLAAQDGGSVNLPCGLVARIRGGEAHLPSPHAAPDHFSLRVSPCEGGGDFRCRETPGVWPAACVLSAKAVKDAGALAIRTRRPGDRMRPFGIGGSRKVQDIFVDCKIPEDLRDEWPIVCAGDEIAWIPGYRIAAPFAVRDGEECIRVEVAKA